MGSRDVENKGRTKRKKRGKMREKGRGEKTRLRSDPRSNKEGNKL